MARGPRSRGWRWDEDNDRLHLNIAGTDVAYFDANGLSVEGGVTVADGGTVTQITSPTTGVTLNASSGQITTIAGTLAAAGEESFTVTNSKVAATDAVVANVAVYGGAGTPVAVVDRVAAGSFRITVSNLHASAALDALMTINFVVVKGASS